MGMHKPTLMQLVAEIVDDKAPDLSAKLEVAIALAPPRATVKEMLRLVESPEGKEKVRVVRKAFDRSKVEGMKACRAILNVDIKRRRDEQEKPNGGV